MKLGYTAHPMLSLLALPLMLTATSPPQPNAAEIAARLQRLNVVGSVLYVAAHPDDENTRLLAWLVGARGMRVGYLSMTRGDGGQNLIGTEQDSLLGLIRTHELLAARRIDGAEQYFTRARDFGYSKSAEETLRFWGHEEVLADVVLAIRRFRPDVVVTRFSTQPPNHGHHTASAMLAAQAFEAAADPKRFPEQLAHVGPWKADRLIHNVPNFNRSPKDDLSKYLKLDVGAFDPLSGRSWGELAAESRSQHKSQGFGVAAERGPSFEYFAPLAGTQPKADIFEGLELGWQRWKGTQAVSKAIADAVAAYDVRAPHRSLPALQTIHAALSALPDDNPWKSIKLRETESLIAACAGLFFEARAAEATATPGSEIKVNLVALNRSPSAVKLISISVEGAAVVNINAPLVEHVPFKESATVAIPATARITTPYWLRLPGTYGRHELEPRDQPLIGQPEAPPALSASFVYALGGKQFSVVQPVVYGWTDPVRGELARLFEIAPEVTATLERDVVMFPNGKAQRIGLVVAAGRANVEGKVKLELPVGWTAKPADVPFKLAARGDELSVAFEVTPPRAAGERVKMRVLVEQGGKAESWRVKTVNHEHIPLLTVRQASEATLVPVALATKIKRLGYIPGPGDRVAESLAAVGYDVTLLPEEKLASEKLEAFETILVGVRAFNAEPRLALHRDRLMKYVEQGGKLIVQYNTNSRVGPLNALLGPYPLELGRDRVTDENAKVVPLLPDEALLKAPNKLSSADFDGWVQERGLYFASKWDERYRPVFEMNDAGEPATRGSVLVARHGKGTFVYTGLSFFRQLPAGVPGAYRLLANLLAQVTK